MPDSEFVEIVPPDAMVRLIGVMSIDPISMSMLPCAKFSARILPPSVINTSSEVIVIEPPAPLPRLVAEMVPPSRISRLSPEISIFPPSPASLPAPLVG